MQRKSKSIKSFIFLAIIIIFIIFSFIIAYSFLRPDIIANFINKQESIYILFSVSQAEKPLMLELFLYNPATHKAAIIYFPGNVWSLLEHLNRYDKIEVLYNSANIRPLVEKIEKMTDLSIPFYIDIQLDNLSKLVDLLGGLELFIPNPIDIQYQDRKILIQSGSVLLDGDKLSDYLLIERDEDTEIEDVLRKHEFLKSLLKKLTAPQTISYLFKPQSFNFLMGLLKTNLSGREIQSFIEEVSKLNMESIIFTRVRGTLKVQENGEKILFPLNEGEYLKLTVTQLVDLLTKTEAISQEDINLSLEVLNGTEIAKLAANTAEIYKRFGYNIHTIDNADNNEYEKTIVIDRKGDIEAAQRAADIIKCNNVITKINRDIDEAIDITIILGRDFDGRYCK